MSTTLSRPYFAEAELRNDLPALAQLERKLVRWLTFSKQKDLVYAPADPVVDTAIGTYSAPQNGEAGTPASQDVLIGTFFVPPTMNGARSLRMRFFVTFDGAGCTLTIRVRSRSTGQVTDIGPVAANGWVSGTVPITGDVDVMQVSTYGTGAFPAHVISYSAWYDTSAVERPDVVATDPWVFGLSQSYFAGGGSANGLHAHALRWLARRANFFSANHVRMVAAKWLGPRSGVGNGIARYKVWIGSPKCTQVVVSAYLSGFVPGGGSAAGMTATVTVNVGASSVTTANGAVGTGSYLGAGGAFTYYALTQWTVTLPGGNAGPCEAEIVINNTSGAGSVNLGSVAVWEVAPGAGALALPAGDVVPAAWPTLVERTARGVISAADIGALVAGMVWVHAKRPRQLVKDNVFKALAATGYNNDIERLTTTAGAVTASRCDVLTSPDNSAARSLKWYAANAYDDSAAAANTPASVLANNWITRLSDNSLSFSLQDLPIPQVGVGLVGSWYGTASYNANRADWLAFQLSSARSAGFDTFWQQLWPRPGATVTTGMKVVTIPYGCAFEELEPNV